MASTWKIHLTVVYLSILCVVANAQSKQIPTKTVVLNVTAVSESNQKYSVQLNLNVGVLDNETFINGAPLKPSGVTRMTCPALLLDGSNVSSSNPADGLVSSELRLMANQSYVQSVAGEQLLLLVLNQEIIQLADEKVQQPDACEVEILWNQSFEIIMQVTSVYSSSRSKLSAIPRESDVLVTNASIRNTVEDQVLNTTSHYLLKHAETTQEEIAAPGKLPETPLRMDPETLYESREEEEMTSDSLRLGPPLSGSMSSYSVACQWVEGLRDQLKRFFSDSVPLFFLIMWVVVIGVAGSAVILKILDLLFPSCEHRGIFHLNPETLMPDVEKQRLVDNMEGEMTEKSVLIEK
ncbi:hypothetical protein Q8A67_017097 [Cirrhinus molitorella]|uniref:Glycoprotein integral membrane protein 1 n=1 Tax=Cirrhinus molitorella TaxID=172907 RepID=A0AA88PIY1_9TELE|nr:hypothetical protein Q8A67_017097 [Cirrhinus molitorella]